MTAWTEPKDWPASGPISDTDLNGLRDNLKNLDERLTIAGITSPSALPTLQGALGMVGVKAKRAASQILTAGSYTSVIFNEADLWDTDDFHDIVTNNKRIIIPTGLGGYYLLIGASQQPGGVEIQELSFRVNGEDGTGTMPPGGSAGFDGVSETRGVVTALHPLVAGDYVTLGVQVAGSGSVGIAQSYLTAVRLFGS